MMPSPITTVPENNCGEDHANKFALYVTVSIGYKRVCVIQPMRSPPHWQVSPPFHPPQPKLALAFDSQI